jgi:hypothetical protein
LLASKARWRTPLVAAVRPRAEARDRRHRYMGLLEWLRAERAVRVGAVVVVDNTLRLTFEDLRSAERSC